MLFFLCCKKQRSDTMDSELNSENAGLVFNETTLQEQIDQESGLYPETEKFLVDFNYQEIMILSFFCFVVAVVFGALWGHNHIWFEGLCAFIFFGFAIHFRLVYGEKRHDANRYFLEQSLDKIYRQSKGMQLEQNIFNAQKSPNPNPLMPQD